MGDKNKLEGLGTKVSFSENINPSLKGQFIKDIEEKNLNILPYNGTDRTNNFLKTCYI